MKILVTGGAGYKGTILVPKLLNQGNEVVVLDPFWFGDYLTEHPNLKKVNGDVRKIKEMNLSGYDLIIHLASVANDPCSDLDPLLTWEVSCQATYDLVDHAVRSGVPRIIYASSGSVYGVKEDEKVTEDLELIPLSAYNRTKICSERILRSYKDDILVQIVRPATVCGFSPRMRLDVAVNLLTMQALKNGKIIVLGGEQMRPNIHIQDITDLYLFLISHPELDGTYNAGFENMKIIEIANLIANKLGSQIEVQESNDPRSYRVDSSLLLSKGFAPKYSVEYAIDEIISNFKNKIFYDDENHYNVGWMRRLMADGKIGHLK